LAFVADTDDPAAGSRAPAIGVSPLSRRTRKKLAAVFAEPVTTAIPNATVNKGYSHD
jgi:hypothetical protein